MSDPWSDIPGAREKARAWLAEHPQLSEGQGSGDRLCSIAALNMAVTGRLSDARPTCVARSLYDWVIAVQDAMPEAIRQSPAWAEQLPRLIGSAYPSGVYVVAEHRRIRACHDFMWQALRLAMPYGAWPVEADASVIAACDLRSLEAIMAARGQAAVGTHSDLPFARGVRDALNAAAHAVAQLAMVRIGNAHMAHVTEATLAAVDAVCVADALNSSRAAEARGLRWHDRPEANPVQQRLLAFWAALDPVGALKRIIDAPDAP